MTTDQFIKKMEAKLAEITKDNKPLLIAVKTVMALQSKRIFLDGKNSENSDIGKYKGGEIYVSPKFPKGATRSLPKFPLKGKGGKSKFENGNSHKTGYFESYLSFKETIGRNKRVKSVDLILTGDLSRDWANAEVVSNVVPRKISANHYQVTLKDKNWVKVEENYSKTFDLSTQEKETFLKVLNFELKKALE